MFRSCELVEDLPEGDKKLTTWRLLWESDPTKSADLGGKDKQASSLAPDLLINKSIQLTEPQTP